MPSVHAALPIAIQVQFMIGSNAVMSPTSCERTCDLRNPCPLIDAPGTDSHPMTKSPIQDSPTEPCAKDVLSLIQQVFQAAHVAMTERSSIADSV